MSQVVACHAPSTSMYLDQHGNVTACCQNKGHLLGNISEASLVEIWQGAPAVALRRAMERSDLTLGCDFCKWQVDAGRPALAFSRWFTEFRPASADPTWPQQLELSISNTCNLACVMCNGEWSSTIRSRREGRPPLRSVYGDDFFDELRLFAPHLRSVKLLGGEPFLATETLRVLELIIEEGASPRCHVTTNGTQWTPRVERMLQMLPIDVSVSLDAVTAATYESIRVGADHGEVWRNLHRYREMAERRGTSVGLTFCLMTVNWQEFAAFCRLGDDLDLDVVVNTVPWPEHMSPYQQPVDVLAEIVAGLQSDARGPARRLGRNRAVWEAELQRLRQHLDDRKARRVVPAVDVPRAAPVDLRVRDVRPVPDPDRRRPSGYDDFAVEADHLLLDNDDLVVDGSAQVLGVSHELLAGRRAADLFEVFTEHLAPVVEMVIDTEMADDVLTRVELADGRVMRFLAVPALAIDGVRAGTDVYVRWKENDFTL